ncbi:hypothetical protein [Candidatus Mycolicibacterium alkanivorans]|uniref:Uncharacterized protein n=1 Tax=Candidatus Mycolicibacterium alkanivorans TaxID=2954114 RepID=A0ABS9YWC6_9MYCO|nr:hypothetical protein [Candidatus Mycolicibacterium alkanivorans]MCI4674664.1 hypothetical protein [Candidatus Mycolicibacterium alkanivorans]
MAGTIWILGGNQSDAARIEDGPVCKLQQPERISSGTHSTWVGGESLRRWHTADMAAEAIGL